MRRALTALAAMAVVAASAAAGYHFYRSATPETAAGTAPHRHTPAGPDTAIIGTGRAEFTLPDLQGRQRDIGEWDGKVIALNFWATWCPPCLEEIPRLVTLQSQYGGRGLQIIGIALQKPGDVVAFTRKHGMNYPVLAGEMPVVKVAEAYGNQVGALPYTVVIDRRGRIAFLKQGPVTAPEMRKVIQPLL